jgi:hypothetical protein
MEWRDAITLVLVEGGEVFLPRENLSTVQYSAILSIPNDTQILSST